MRQADDVSPGRILFAVLVGLPLCLGGCYGLSGVQVSDGYRDSTVRKVSESGVFWKTWEVETLGEGFRFRDGNASPETFTYTVADRDIVSALQSLPPGKRVRVHYRKNLTVWVPHGETRYFVTRVEELSDK